MAKGKKTGGREPGTPNKISGELKKKIKDVITNYINGDFEQDLKDLEPAARLHAMSGLLNYAIPKLKSVELTSNDKSGYVIGFVDNGKYESNA